MSHIYVSYARQDHAFAEALFQRLKEARLTGWADSLQLRDVSDWTEASEDALRRAYTVIVVMSPDAQHSEAVTYEWSAALGMGIAVIPVVIEPMTLHGRLETLSWLDFTRGYYPWNRLVKTLRAVENEYTSLKLVEALRHDPSWETRMVAADMLGELGYVPAVSDLLETLYDEQLEVREAATRALGKLGDPVAILKLIGQLGAAEVELRVAAAWALGKIAAPESIDGLVESLHDDDTKVRWTAAWALGEIGAAAIPGLVEALRDADGRVRGTALGALSKAGVSANGQMVAAVPGLMATLEDENWSVREAAARVLGEIRDVAAVPGLVKALRDEDGRVRGTASGALGALGEPAIPGLIDALHDPNPEVRQAATGVLGVISYKVKSDSTLVSALCIALKDTDTSVRRTAAWALRGMKPINAVSELAEAMRDPDERVSDTARRALYAIGTPGAIAAADAWWREKEKE
jgi:HEAT repeat protein